MTLSVKGLNIGLQQTPPLITPLHIQPTPSRKFFITLSGILVIFTTKRNERLRSKFCGSGGGTLWDAVRAFLKIQCSLTLGFGS